MARKKGRQENEERRGPSMVLVVGDDAGSNELLSRLLNARGFRTAKATTPEEAMSRVGELLPRCVILDLAAGGIGSNLRVLESIRASGDRKISQTRVVLVARSTNNRGFSFQSGVDAFLVRPFHADELVEAVDESLKRLPEDRADFRRQNFVEA